MNNEKVTVVEYSNENEIFTLWHVFLTRNPRQALEYYIKEHFGNNTKEARELKKSIEEIDGEYLLDDIARSYQITAL